MLIVGDLLDGRYEIREVASEKPHAIVYRALARSGSMVAVKELDVDGWSAARVAHLMNELFTCKNLGELFYLPPLAVHKVRDHIYVVTPWIQGKSLLQWMSQDRLSVDMAVDIILELMQRLDRKGIVHPNLKPSNILLDQDERPFLTDFYTQREDKESAHYQSNRQRKTGRATAGDNAYSLGVIFFETTQHQDQIGNKTLPDPKELRNFLRARLNGEQQQGFFSAIELLNHYNTSTPIGRFFALLLGKELKEVDNNEKDEDDDDNTQKSEVFTSGSSLWMPILSAVILLCLFAATLTLTSKLLTYSLIFTPTRTPPKPLTQTIWPNIESLTPQLLTRTPTPSRTPTPLEYEAAMQILPTETDVLGEIRIKYPAWLRPGTGDMVNISIQIPRDMQDFSIDWALRIDLPATATPQIGSLENQHATILVDSRMRVELESSTLDIQPRTPAIQDIDTFGVENPSMWIFAITAPEALGKHRVDLSVFLDEESDQPSWFGSYQVEVVEPTNTPLPTATPSPRPTRTPSPIPTDTPTFTPTITPTLTFLQSTQNAVMEEPLQVIFYILGALAATATALWAAFWKVFPAINNRTDRILKLYMALKDLPEGTRKDEKKKIEEKKKEIQAQINELKSVPWWKFWYQIDKK